MPLLFVLAAIPVVAQLATILEPISQTIFGEEPLREFYLRYQNIIDLTILIIFFSGVISYALRKVFGTAYEEGRGIKAVVWALTIASSVGAAIFMQSAGINLITLGPIFFSIFLVLGFGMFYHYTRRYITPERQGIAIAASIFLIWSLAMLAFPTQLDAWSKAGWPLPLIIALVNLAWFIAAGYLLFSLFARFSAKGRERAARRREEREAREVSEEEKNFMEKAKPDIETILKEFEKLGTGKAAYDSLIKKLREIYLILLGAYQHEDEETMRTLSVALVGALSGVATVRRDMVGWIVELGGQLEDFSRMLEKEEKNILREIKRWTKAEESEIKLELGKLASTHFSKKEASWRDELAKRGVKPEQIESYLGQLMIRFKDVVASTTKALITESGKFEELKARVREISDAITKKNQEISSIEAAIKLALKAKPTNFGVILEKLDEMIKTMEQESDFFAEIEKEDLRKKVEEIDRELIMAVATGEKLMKELENQEKAVLGKIWSW